MSSAIPATVAPPAGHHQQQQEPPAPSPATKRFDPDTRYDELRDQFMFTPSNKRPVLNKFDPDDLSLLEEYKRRQGFYPLRYSVPYLFGLYYFSQHFNVTLLKNPLRKHSVDVSVGPRIRLIYFASIAMFTVPLIHMKYVFRYSSAELYVYEKYKNLVEDYVIARDEAILRAALSEEEGLLTLRK